MAVTAVGLALAFLSLAVSTAFSLVQLGESMVTQAALLNYLVDLHGQMLFRFDRLENRLAEVKNLLELSGGNRA